MLTWYQRRELLLNAAKTEPGWGCVRRVGDRHIGRVIMSETLDFPPGFYHTTSAAYSILTMFFQKKQKQKTSLLPK